MEKTISEEKVGSSGGSIPIPVPETAGRPPTMGSPMGTGYESYWDWTPGCQALLDTSKEYEHPGPHEGGWTAPGYWYSTDEPYSKLFPKLKEGSYLYKVEVTPKGDLKRSYVGSDQSWSRYVYPSEQRDAVFWEIKNKVLSKLDPYWAPSKPGGCGPWVDPRIYTVSEELKKELAPIGSMGSGEVRRFLEDKLKKYGIEPLWGEVTSFKEMDEPVRTYAEQHGLIPDTPQYYGMRYYGNKGVYTPEMYTNRESLPNLPSGYHFLEVPGSVYGVYLTGSLDPMGIYYYPGTEAPKKRFIIVPDAIKGYDEAAGKFTAEGPIPGMPQESPARPRGGSRRPANEEEESYEPKRRPIEPPTDESAEQVPYEPRRRATKEEVPYEPRRPRLPGETLGPNIPLPDLKGLFSGGQEVGEQVPSRGSLGSSFGPISLFPSRSFTILGRNRKKTTKKPSRGLVRFMF